MTTIYIYTKVLINKIQPTLEDITSPDQTTAMKRRTIIQKPVTELGRNVLCKHQQDSGSNDSG